MQEETKSPQETAGERLKLVSADALRDRMRELHDTISRHAYRLFETRGHRHGHDLDDWYDAEREVLHLCRRRIKETHDSIVCTLEVSPFEADDLNVSVEPHRVTVSGERNVHATRADEHGIHEERHPQHLFRAIELPAEVDPSKAIATLRGERLEVVMPKTGAVKPVQPTARAAAPGR